jgi:hypothetical protein
MNFGGLARKGGWQETYKDGEETPEAQNEMTL